MTDRKNTSGGTKAEVTDLVGLIKSYVLQETVGPLKAIARTLAFGSAGAVLLGIGSVLMLVGVLRVLQTETGSVFAGEWNWVPYVLTAVASLALLGAVGASLLRTPRSEKW
jgi:hypothetical protein